MSWSYSDTLLTDRDKVRFYLQDTDTNDQLLTDEEIAFLLTEAGSVRAAAIVAAETVAAKFARYADTSVGDLQLSYSQRYEQFLSLAERLRRQVSLSAVPLAGGISVSRKQTVDEDTDRVAPAFSVGMLSHPDHVAVSADEREQ
jgi:hypothetical protein